MCTISYYDISFFPDLIINKKMMNEESYRDLERM